MRKLWIAGAALAAVLVLSTTVDAHHLDGTTWTLAGTNRIKIPRLPAQTSPIENATLTVGQDSSFTITNAFIDSDGAYVDHGKRGFKATVSQAAQDAARDFMVGATEQATGATSVEVLKFTTSVKGTTTKAGTLVMKAVLKLKGVATIAGKRKKGTVVDVAKFAGVPAS